MIFFPLLLLSQNDVSFEAYCDSKKVVLDGYFELSFTLKNANGQNFKPPSFDNFDVISGPNSSMSTQIINGQISRQMGWSYILMPQKPGKFTIGSASVKADGKILKTSPLYIQVVKGKNPASAGKSGKNTAEAQVFIRAEASTTEARIGQQVLLDYKLYTTVNLHSYSTLSESGYSGFYARDVKRYNSRVFREVMDGVQFTTKVLKRVALFPQQAGILMIDPMKMQLSVVTGETERYGFFSRKKTRPVVVRTEPLEINVRPLPEDAPESFSGAVGKYNFQAGIDNPVLTTDDALKVKMFISGNGDLKRVQPPLLMLPTDSFEIYDPKVLEENTYENQGEVNGKKLVEYFALPKYSGRFVIRPEFTYFDTDSSRYITLKSAPLKIGVRKGTGLAASVASANKTEESKADIRFIKLETKLQKEGRAFFGSLAFWVLVIMPILVLGGVFTFKQIQSKRNALDAGLLKRRRANKVALRRLKTAKKHLDQKDSEPFYDEISRASFGYVCDKLSIPLSELSKDNVREKLHSLQVSAANIDRFMNVIQTCEMALFAGMDNSAAMTETYENAIEVIAGIEEEIAL